MFVFVSVYTYLWRNRCSGIVKDANHQSLDNERIDRINDSLGYILPFNRHNNTLENSAYEDILRRRMYRETILQLLYCSGCAFSVT